MHALLQILRLSFFSKIAQKTLWESKKVWNEDDTPPYSRYVQRHLPLKTLNWKKQGIYYRQCFLDLGIKNFSWSLVFCSNPPTILLYTPPPPLLLKFGLQMKSPLSMEPSTLPVQASTPSSLYPTSLLKRTAWYWRLSLPLS